MHTYTDECRLKLKSLTQTPTVGNDSNLSIRFYRITRMGKKNGGSCLSTADRNKKKPDRTEKNRTSVLKYISHINLGEVKLLTFPSNRFTIETGNCNFVNSKSIFLVIYFYPYGYVFICYLTHTYTHTLSYNLSFLVHTNTPQASTRESDVCRNGTRLYADPRFQIRSNDLP